MELRAYWICQGFNLSVNTSSASPNTVKLYLLSYLNWYCVFVKQIRFLLLLPLMDI